MQPRSLRQPLLALLAAVAGCLLAPAAPAADAEPLVTFNRSGEEAGFGLFTVGPDGGAETRLVPGRAWVGAFAWSPDGESIAYTTRRPNSRSVDLYLARPDGGFVRRLARRVSDADASPPAWAPDGRS